MHPQARTEAVHLTNFGMTRSIKALLVLVFAAFHTIAVGQSMGQSVLGGALQGLAKGMQEHLRQEAENERLLEIERQRAEIWAAQQRQIREEEIAQQRQAARLAALKKARDDEQAKVTARQIGGTGSGFFVTDRGHIVTNAHVVGDFLNVLIKDSSSSLFEARVIRVDKERDLALLVVDRKSKGLRIASSTSDLKGEDVYAVGYPMPGVQGQESKITNGVISSLSGIQGLDSWMQISAAIQGGNSGGPLVTSKGEVVGVVVAQVNALKVLERSGSILQNVNYAIKSELLLDFLRLSSISNVSRPVGGRPLRSVDEETVMVLARDKPFSDAFVAKPSGDRLKSNEELELEDYGVVQANFKPEGSPYPMRAFIRDYPGSVRVAEVRKRLTALEKARWESANRQSTYYSLTRFIEDFPDSVYAKVASAQLLKLDNAAFEQAAKANTVQALSGYITLFPSGRNMSAANKLYEQLKEDELWAQTMRSTNEGPFLNYLQKYPQGQHALAAKTQIENIRIEKASAPKEQSPLLGPASGSPQISAATTTVGEVFEVFPTYGYLVMDTWLRLDVGQPVQVRTLSGKSILGKVSKLLGQKASVLVSGDISAIKKGDQIVK